MQLQYYVQEKLLIGQLLFLKAVFKNNIIKMFVLSTTTGWLIILNKELLKTLFFIKTSFLTQTDHLIDIIINDNPSKKHRYNVYYVLQNNKKNFFLYLNFSLKEGQPICSIQYFFCNANWLEREIWDFFGIFFSENKDLRMLLSDYSTKCNPLKKTYPLTGYNEIAYSNINKKLSFVPVQLAKFRVKT